MAVTEPLVLYVDDERANRVVFEQTFLRRFRVRCVESAQQALDVLASEPVAVLVTDQRMPGMSGGELLARVKVLSPDTIRIIITAYADLDPILKAVNEGLVVRYIIKPWNRVELEETLSWALEMYAVGCVSSAIQLRLIQTERVLTLGQVAATVLHDLYQPLTCIVYGATELVELASLAPLLSRVTQPGPSLDVAERDQLTELARALPEIAGEVKQRAAFMLDVLDQLRRFMKKDAVPTEVRDVDPVPIVTLAVSMCREGATLAGCSVAVEVPKNLPRVRATTSEALQILMNLLRNAQQSLEQKSGGGRVVIEAVERHDDVRFVVRDDGAGMSAEVLAKLGTPFFTTRELGTGLGIAQVRRLVGRIGGSIEIESTEGKGTTVAFTIPKADSVVRDRR